MLITTVTNQLLDCPLYKFTECKIVITARVVNHLQQLWNDFRVRLRLKRKSIFSLWIQASTTADYQPREGESTCYVRVDIYGIVRIHRDISLQTKLYRHWLNSYFSSTLNTLMHTVSTTVIICYLYCFTERIILSLHEAMSSISRRQSYVMYSTWITKKSRGRIWIKFSGYVHFG